MDDTGEKRRPGRPKKDPSELKRRNVTIAMADPIRDAIGEAADRNGRSISSEIDFRLGMSLALDKDTGSASVRRLIDFTRLAALKLQEDAGKDWTEDYELAAAIGAAVTEYIRNNSPQREGQARWEDEANAFRDQIQAATAEVGGDVDNDEKMASVIAPLLMRFAPFIEAQSEMAASDYKVKKRAIDTTGPLASLFQIRKTS